MSIYLAVTELSRAAIEHFPLAVYPTVPLWMVGAFFICGVCTFFICTFQMFKSHGPALPQIGAFFVAWLLYFLTASIAADQQNAMLFDLPGVAAPPVTQVRVTGGGLLEPQRTEVTFATGETVTLGGLMRLMTGDVLIRKELDGERYYCLGAECHQLGG